MSGVVTPAPSIVTKPAPVWLEVMVIATVPGPLTVKVDVAVLEDASVTVIVWEPVDAPEGTEEVTPEGIAPAELVVTVAGVVVRVVVSNFTVIADDAANPEPDSPTEEPVVPDVGLNVIEAPMVTV